MQPRHHGAERALEDARQIAVAQPFEIGELDDTTVRRRQAFERRQHVGVELGPLGLDGRGLREHARLEALIARALAMLGHRDVVEDAVEPRARIRAAPVAALRLERVQVGLLHEVVGIAAEPPRSPAQGGQVRQHLVDKFSLFARHHAAD